MDSSENHVVYASRLDEAMEGYRHAGLDPASIKMTKTLSQHHHTGLDPVSISSQHMGYSLTLILRATRSCKMNGKAREDAWGFRNSSC